MYQRLFHDPASQLRILSYDNTLFSRLVIFAKQIFAFWNWIFEQSVIKEL